MMKDSSAEEISAAALGPTGLGQFLTGISRDEAVVTSNYIG